FQHPAEDHAHDARLPQRRGDAGNGLLSFGRCADTVRSGEAAINSRHGAFEPGIGGRAAVRAISAFSFSIASSVGGTMEEVTRLPPEAGPFGRCERPMRTSTSAGSSENSLAMMLAITLRVP